jgi:flagellar biosynthesis protein FliR
VSSDFKKGFAIGLGVMGALLVVGLASGVLQKAF